MLCDMWHLTHYIWHVICDSWRGWPFSPHFMFLEWIFKDTIIRDDFLNWWISDKGVHETATAIPGLLATYSDKVEIISILNKRKEEEKIGWEIQASTNVGLRKKKDTGWNIFKIRKNSEVLDAHKIYQLRFLTKITFSQSLGCSHIMSAKNGRVQNPPPPLVSQKSEIC